METVLSGIKPTGKMHLGNYIGAVQNWVRIQDSYNCLYMVADLHALTTHIDNFTEIHENIVDIYMDLLACGIDVKKSILFIQSAVPAHAKLHLILSMITPLGWLERNPTFKEHKQELKNKDLNNYGFLGYPVLQAADILIYHANRVPVGQDQLPYLELTREIARRFNTVIRDYFPEPLPLLTKVPKIVGTDGRKMSKSYENAIYLSDQPEELEDKLKKFITDTNKIRKNDPGDPEKCTVYPFYSFFAAKQEQAEVNTSCRSGQLGCVECKKRAAVLINQALEPYREKKNAYKKNLDFIYETINNNNNKANKIADKCINEIYNIIGLKYGK